MTVPGWSIALLSLPLLVPACDVTDGGSVRIEVMVAGDSEEIEAYRSVVDAFNDAEGETRAELIPFAERDELIARLSTSIAGGEPPDVFLMNYRYYGQFAAREALEPMASYLERSSVLSPRDFYSTAMAPFRWDGRQVCLPQNVSSLVAYFNADLFEASGVPLPMDGWTWDDMVRAARRLTTDRDGDGTPDVHGVGVDPEIIRVAPFMWSNGGEMIDEDADPFRFAVDAPSVIAMQRFFDLRTVDKVTPTEEERESEDLVSRFVNGRLAILLESRRVVPTLRTIDAFEWDVAPIPVFREPVSILHSDAYCMTGASDAKEHAWRFVEFALGPQGQRITARAGRTVPSLRSVAESEDFLDPRAEPSNSRVFLDQIPHLRSVPTVSTWPEVEDIVNVLLEEGYDLGLPAREIAIEIVTQTDDVLARAE
jgi:multiple sugar transport system substrate-binding protein